MSWKSAPHRTTSILRKVFLVIGVLGIGAPVDSFSAERALPPGLIAYWPLDEGSGIVAHDVSGLSNHGSVSGAEWVQALNQSGLEFVDTDIVSNIPSSFDNTVGNSLTVAAWIYWYGPHPGTYSANSYILDARQWSAGCSGFILFLSPSGQVVFQLTLAGCTTQVIVSQSSVPVGTWTHVAALLDYPASIPPPRQLRVYLNGVPDQASEASFGYRHTELSAAMGNNRWAPGDGQYAPFNGVLDEVMVFNRALSDVEVGSLAGPPDCNTNEIEDACDVDCGEPGGPCDVPECGQSADCNANIVPDECEWDCNRNGVPDACDVDPSDPDGNGQVSADDNFNGVPDECDVDCNGNGLPDPCDLDCGEPGGPCYISGCGQGEDCNGNYVPDNCEAPLGFLVSPQSITIFEGEGVTMSSTATGPPPLQIQWRKNGIDIPNATTDSYSIATTTLADSGRYDVTAACGPLSTTSSAATLTVLSRRAKWPQLLTENPGPEGDFYGWEVASRYDRLQIAADDWACLGDEPISEITWWGSYRHLISGEGFLDELPPGTDPLSFHIAIWTNVPAGVDQPWSHPGIVLREWTVPLDQVGEHWVGTQYHPSVGIASTFQYHFVIPPEQWFEQDTEQDVYWLSIAAQYSCNCLADMNLDDRVTSLDTSAFVACDNQPPPPTGRCEFADTDCDGDVDSDDLLTFQCQLMHPMNPLFCCSTGGDWPSNHVWVWGWTTRRPSWNDAALIVTQPTAPTQGSIFFDGQPIQNGEGNWDLAFTLVTQTAPQPQACCVPGPDCLDGLLPWQCVQEHDGKPAGLGVTCATASPSIMQQPLDADTCIGGSVSFSVAATGATPLTYLWEKNGEPIPGTNTPTLELEDVDPLDAGIYTVRISNSCGAVLSLPAILAVWPTGIPDVSGDGPANALDIQPFVDVLLGYDTNPRRRCACDMDGDGDLDTNDISLFVTALLSAM